MTDELTTTAAAAGGADAQAEAERRAADAKARRAARKAARAATPPPERDHAYDHLTLDDLRTLRAALDDEETKVAYWRRIISGRLDAVRSGNADREPVADLRGVLHEADTALARLGAIDVPPVDELSPLPDLAEVWARPCDPQDARAVAALVGDLEEAETDISEYREELVRREEAVTRELIARYREEPLLALQTLPGDPLTH